MELRIAIRSKKIDHMKVSFFGNVSLLISSFSSVMTYLAGQIGSHEDGNGNAQMLMNILANELNAALGQNVKALNERDALSALLQLAPQRSQGSGHKQIGRAHV